MLYIIDDYAKAEKRAKEHANQLYNTNKVSPLQPRNIRLPKKFQNSPDRQQATKKKLPPKDPEVHKPHKLIGGLAYLYTSIT